MILSVIRFQQFLGISVKPNVKYLTTCSALSMPRKSVLGPVSMKMQHEEIEDMDHYESIDRDMNLFQENIAQLEKDAVQNQKFIRNKTVEQKYFKELSGREENLLTYEMKTQLRYLHNNDPNTWTYEALSKAFPISPTGVMKLLKSNWEPKNEAEIKRHDSAVAARWKKYMKGKLGSAVLIEKALLKKPSNQSAPTPIIGTDELLNSLQNLKFDYSDGNIHKEPRGLKYKNRLPKTSKYKANFSKIITNYEDQLSKINESENTDKNTASVTTTASSPTTGAPQYHGRYSKISTPISEQNATRKKSLGAKKNMTFDDFIKWKKI